MKTEIVIKQGNAKIVLRAENEFEEDLIEKIKDSKVGCDFDTFVATDNEYGSYFTHKNHRIEISLTEKKKQPNFKSILQ